MGNINSINNYNTVTFENIQEYIKNNNSNIILLNTLNKNYQCGKISTDRLKIKINNKFI